LRYEAVYGELTFFLHIDLLSMLIEFCCPVCQAPLAIQKQAVGGQVNCPKCQKIILLPAESPLPRKQEDLPPYSPGQERTVEEIAKAIHLNVDPYRRDLDNKSELLNDAVEMIKVRNERIREIESLILETQKELWEAEVHLDEQKETNKKTRSQLKEVRQELRGTRDEETERGGEVRELRLENERLTKEMETLLEKKDALKLRLSNMVQHAEQLEGELKHHREAMTGENGMRKEVDAIYNVLTKRLEHMPGELEDIQIAMGYLKQSGLELERLQNALEERERQRSDLEELVRSSSVDMQNALDDRKQWRNQALELEKRIAATGEERAAREEELARQLTEAQTALQTLKIEQQEEEKIREERDEDLRQAKASLSELEESLVLHRQRAQEQETAQEDALEAARETGREESAAKVSELEKELNELRLELEETESKLDGALATQQQLAEQNLQGEKERKELKRKLRDSLKPASS